MQMILRAIEGQGNPSEVSNGSTDVVIKTDFIVGRYQCAAILRRKDDVVKEISVRVTHDSRLSRVSTEDFYQGPSAASRTLESIGILPGVRWRSPRALCRRPRRGLHRTVRRQVCH